MVEYSRKEQDKKKKEKETKKVEGTASNRFGQQKRRQGCEE